MLRLSEAIAEPLPDEVQLALAHTPERLRGRVRTYFELDQRLARIVGATTEPMLGQMRLAWWRETLAKPRDERPTGDFVLDAIGEHWAGSEEALSKLVDAWEFMLGETLDEVAARQFGKLRVAPLDTPAERWALTDAAVHVPEGVERNVLLDLAGKCSDTASFTREVRGFAVLDALARRSLKRGGRPLMEGRGAALVAARAAILGR